MDQSTEYALAKEYPDLLESTKGEREVSEHLRKCPQLLYWALCRGAGHDRYVFREFPLGNSYKADFVVLNSYSGVWEVFFIELEPVDSRFFTNAGIPADRLRGAVKQVDDWRRYFEENKAQVRADFVRWAKQRDLLGYSSGDDPSNYSGNRLADPASYLDAKFKIIVGRRNALNPEEARWKAEFRNRHSVEVISYDRISDVVAARYRNKEEWVGGKS